MHSSPDVLRLEPVVPATWLESAALALFALGIPLDVMIASRIGSSSIVLGAPLVAVACWHVLVTGRIRTLPGSLLLVVGFTAWGTASMLWARDLEAYEIVTTTYAQLLLFVLLCWQVLGSERALRAIAVGFVAGCIGVVAGVWEAFLAGRAIADERYEGGTRFAAEGFDPNDMGVTLAIGIPMAAYLALAGGRRARVALAYVPLAWSAIMLSGSRAATVTAAVAIAALLLWLALRRRGGFALGLALVALGVALSWRFVPWETWARIFTLREQLAGGGTVGDRHRIWRAALELFERDPLAGVGAGGFSSAVVPVLGTRVEAHSTLLTVAVELGVVGVVLYGGAFAAALREVLRWAADRRGFGVALLVIRGFEYTTLNVRWDDNAYGSILWLLLSLHTAHLATDVYDTAVLAAVFFSGRIEGKRHVDVSENGMYWYFVVACWIPVYAIVYWAPRLL